MIRIPICQQCIAMRRSADYNDYHDHDDHDDHDVDEYDDYDVDEYDEYDDDSDDSLGAFDKWGERLLMAWQSEKIIHRDSEDDLYSQQSQL